MKLASLPALLLSVTIGICGGLAQSAKAESLGPIQIVSAVYGKPNDPRPADFTLRLQQTCGDSATECDVFCSNAFVGRANGLRLPFSVPPICRVTYRCGAQATFVTDADKNESLYLSCRARR